MYLTKQLDPTIYSSVVPTHSSYFIKAVRLGDDL